MGFLIDTCLWIDVERGAVSPADIAAVTGDAPVFLSPVTIAEMKFGAEVAPTPEARQQRLAALAKMRRKPVLPIDETTGEIFGDLAARLREVGRGGHRRRVNDLWMASQAIQNGFSLLTRNGKDFADIPGLRLVLWKGVSL